MEKKVSEKDREIQELEEQYKSVTRREEQHRRTAAQLRDDLEQNRTELSDLEQRMRRCAQAAPVSSLRQEWRHGRTGRPKGSWEIWVSISSTPQVLCRPTRRGGTDPYFVSETK